MNKTAAILITILILITLFINVTKPVMHKQMMITDANFAFVEESSEPQNVPLQPAPQKQEPPKTIQTQKQTPPSSSVSKPKTTVPAVTKPPVKKTSVKQTPSNRTQTQITPVKQTAVKKTPPKQTAVKKQTASKPVTKPASQSSAKTQQPKTETKKETKQTPQKVVKEPSTTVHQLTEQEEIIAWNKWRSDVQNQVMRDTKIAAPLGTAFKFSFTVDKFGNISNIKVWSLNPVYTETGVRVIKPVLASYQGKPILKFPQGTKRVITNVTGGFVMAESTGFSTPSDFSDYERVKK